MSYDLMQRLRDAADLLAADGLQTVAMDVEDGMERIEALEVKNKQMREALSRIAYPASLHGSAMAAARAALADPETEAL